MERALSSGMDTLKAVSNSNSIEIVSSESKPRSTSELSIVIFSRGICFTLERIVITFSANSSGIHVPPGSRFLAGPLGNISVHRRNRNAKVGADNFQQPIDMLKNRNYERAYGGTRHWGVKDW